MSTATKTWTWTIRSNRNSDRKEEITARDYGWVENRALVCSRARPTQTFIVSRADGSWVARYMAGRRLAG